jgi:hypothetical protein
MKKTLLLLVFSSTFITYANCQITKDNWLVGGTASFSITTPNVDTIGSRSTIVNISPNIGYFIIDKLAAGIHASYQKNHIKLLGQSDYSNNATAYSIGPFVRYYFLPSDQQFNILSEACYELGNEKEDNNVYSNNLSINSFSLSFGPVVYFNNSVGLEFLLSYTSSGNGNHDNHRTSSYRAGVGLQIHLEKEKNY